MILQVLLTLLKSYIWSMQKVSQQNARKFPSFWELHRFWRTFPSVLIDRWHDTSLSTIVHFFSSVAYVWVSRAKTTGPIAKKFGFSEILIFFGSEKFQVLAHVLSK
jgi:hypothetical protein